MGVDANVSQENHRGIILIKSWDYHTHKMLTKLTVLAVCVYTCTAHLCLISPPQRGSMEGLNKGGSDDCILLKPPCGGRDRPQHPIGLGAGENFTVTFQKNLDHFNASTPGYFSVSLLELEGRNHTVGHEVYKTEDTSAPSLSLYSANITINFDKYHPGYFGKVGMRYFHKTQQKFFCPTVNVRDLWAMLSEKHRTHYLEGEAKAKAPVIDVEDHGFYKVLGDGFLPKNRPLIVKAKFFSKQAEKKIKAAGGACVLHA